MSNSPPTAARRSFRLQSVNQHAQIRRPNLRCFIRNAVPEYWAIGHRQAKQYTESAQKGRGPFLTAQSFLRAVWDENKRFWGSTPSAPPRRPPSPRELDRRGPVCSCGQTSTLICANAWCGPRLSPRKSFSPRSIPTPMEMLPHLGAASAWCPIPAPVVRSTMFNARCSTHARQCSSACLPASHQSCSAHTRNFPKDATQFDRGRRLAANKHSISCLALDSKRPARAGGSI